MGKLQNLLALRIKPGPLLTFSQVAFVHHDKKLFKQQGMQGLFIFQESTLFTLSLGDLDVPVFAMGLWVSHPEGRVSKIIDRWVRTQRKFLLQYFLKFRPIHCMI